MENIIWKAVTKKGQLICQQNDGKYNNFMDYDRSQWMHFTLFNKKNNANYGIDLLKGCFLFNGLPMQPAIQNGVYDIPIIAKQPFNYGKTLFWYNQFMAQLNTNTNQNKCLNVFAGYSINVDIDTVINNKHGKVKIVRPCIKINTITNMASFSTSYLFEYVQGEKIIKVQG